jgi:4-hydroxybenzoyl-CoA reductase subunit beta
MRLPSFDFHAPDTLDKALKLKGDMGGSAHILAGGTDLIVNLKHRLASPAAVISLKNINEMRGIESRPDSVIIRAGTPLAETADNETIKEHFPVLVKAIQSIGAVGIQYYRGTIGGNLCLTPRCIFYNQSHFWRTGKGSCHRTGGKECLALEGSESCQAVCSGDTVPVFIALSAQLTIAGAGGKRTLPASDFFTGKGESPFKMTPDEILTEIRLPIPWGPLSWSYQRLSIRSAVDFPLINAACTAIVDKGSIENFRLVLCSAGPGPVILREAESLFKRKAPDPHMAQRAEEIAVRAAEGIIVENAVASKDYRVKMAGVLARRAVQEALNI